MVDYKLVPIESLHEDPKNARAHPERNKAAVRSSLTEFGQVEALVVQKGTGLVIGGNCRLVELLAMGATEVMVSEVEVTGQQATRLGLALNRSAETAEWDDEALTELLKGLGEDDLLEGLGWDDDELEALLGEHPDADAWGDAVGGLPEGDRAPIQQMTFTVHDDQAEAVREAISKAKALGSFGDTGNENSNGNALARICEAYRG